MTTPPLVKKTKCFCGKYFYKRIKSSHRQVKTKHLSKLKGLPVRDKRCKTCSIKCSKQWEKIRRR